MADALSPVECLEKIFAYYVNDIGLSNSNAKMVRETLRQAKGYDPLLDHHKKPEEKNDEAIQVQDPAVNAGSAEEGIRNPD